jgi:hypothetical protein
MATRALSEELGNHVSFDHIRISWFNKLIITNLHITDLRGDTLLTTSELIGRLNLLTFSSKNIELRKAVLNKADIRLANDPEMDVINLKFIIDKLKSEDTTQNKKKWLFGIRTIELNDSRFSFTNSLKPFERPFGMNYAGLDISNLNLIISDFRVGDKEEGGVSFHIRKLSCAEKCGFVVDFLSADFYINRNNLSFKNVMAVTSRSELYAKDVSFVFDSFQDFGSGKFISKVKMAIDIQAADASCRDLANFAPVFATYADTVLSLSGKVTGTVEDMKGDKIEVSAGETTYIKCNFDLKGLPHLKSTFIYTDVSELHTCPSDIEKIQVKHSRTGHVHLPEAMNNITSIGFKGNFTGFFDDFVTFGTFSTNLGNLSTDVSIKPVKESDADTTFTFNGALKTERFHLGKLLTQSSIGEVTMSGVVNGSAASRGNIQATIEGLIAGIGLRGYEYRDISINGAINNRTYDGQLSIDEPNIKMDFSGKVDLTDPVPAYDFWANVERAYLHRLNIVKKDTSSFASFTIKAGFSGTNIDNLMGELDLEKSLFRRNGREIEINNLEIFTKAISDTNRFILLSDIVNAEVWGQYQFLKLPESFFSLVKNYAPAWVPESVRQDSLSNNKFRFMAEFGDTEKLTKFFTNEFFVSRGTRLEGHYNPAQKEVSVVLNVPYMNFDGNRWEGFYLNGSTEDSVFVFESGSRKFRVGNNMTFENLTFLARADGDSVDFNIRWNNWDSVLNKGNLMSKIFFVKKPKQTHPSIHVFSSPGQIVTSGDVWALTHKGISIDSTTVVIDGLRALRNDQEILISGAISKNENDKLLFSAKDLDLSIVNKFLQIDKLSFAGVANGTASLSNLYDVPVFVSNIHIDGLALNDGLLGNANLKAAWLTSNRSVHIEMESILNDLRTLFLKGNYCISDRSLDFGANIERVPACILQPFVDNVFTGLEGMLSSELKLTGKLSDPLLNGEIDMRRTALTLDYTKARYHFSGKAKIRENSIYFDNIDLYDTYGNLCKTNGSVTLERFRNISFDVRLQPQNFEVLNTKEKDNDLFYGKAFATGNVHVFGTPNDMTLNITARTEKNTGFKIPLTSTEQVTKSSFISFVDHTPRSQKRPYEFRRRRSLEASAEITPEEQKFAVNIALDITPDAEAELIFDAKIGDIIYARGNGNLTLNITNNKFDMFGSYTIDEGNYRFTLRDFFNKRFLIEKGGLITWNGDPLGALINLKAIYTTRPSLYDLIGDERYKRSVPVECVLHISNKLTNPNIRFELLMPNAEQEIRSYLAAATSSEEEMTRQFLYLLMANRFYPNPNLANQNIAGGSSGTGLETMGLATASEFLTNQLSHMISQWSKDFDVDFFYHPGTELTGQNIGMDLSTNLWSLHMDYEVGNTEYAALTNNSSVVGDFTFDIKLNKSGKLRFKAFNRANRYLTEQSPYTQGIGLSFREDFNHFRDLFRQRDKKAIRREDEKEMEEDGEPDSSAREVFGNAAALPAK